MRRGQATTEYLLLLSFLVVAVIAAAWAILPFWDDGLDGLGDDATEILGDGASRGSNDKR